MLLVIEKVRLRPFVTSLVCVCPEADELTIIELACYRHFVISVIDNSLRPFDKNLFWQ